MSTSKPTRRSQPRHASRKTRWAAALRLVFAAAFVAGIAMLAVSGVAQTEDAKTKDAQTKPGKLAIVLDIKGPIGPATSDYIRRGLEKARERSAALVVIRMDTPGGLDTSMREIIQDIIASPIPVATHVTSGGRAASAGAYILIASHFAAMAPGTSVGAATPVRIGGAPKTPRFPGQRPPPEPEKDDKGKQDKKDDKAGADKPAKAAKPGLDEKMMNDAAAYIRSLAQMRGRNAKWAETAVREAASLSADDAEKQKVIDFVAADVPALLAKLDGRPVTIHGRTGKMETKALVLQPIESDWRNELLKIVTNPNIAYLLMTLGMTGILVEIYSPGLIFPGVTGAICLLLAFYGLHVMPVSYAGAALILLGLALLAAEAFVPSFGVLGLGGLVAFVIGSVMLIDTDQPDYGISWYLIGAVAVVSGGLLLIITALLARTHRRGVVTGSEEMLGIAAEVIDWSGGAGRVRVHGEVWQARGAGTMDPGQRVRVTEIDGLTVGVEPDSAPQQSPTTTTDGD